MKTTARTLLTILALASLSPSIALAAAPPAPGSAVAAETRLKSFDLRSGLAAEDLGVPVGHAAALKILHAALPQVKVRFDTVTQAPCSIMALGHFLSEPIPGADARKPVLLFIDRYAELFGHKSNALEAGRARLTRDDVTKFSGMHTLVWQQELDGIPLFDLILMANLTRSGELIAIGSHFLPDPEKVSQIQAEKRKNLIALPPVGAEKAVVLAAQNLGDEAEAEKVKAKGAAQGAERKQLFAGLKSGDAQAALTWFPVSRKQVRLAWEVTLTSLREGGRFRLVLDAQGGQVMRRESLTWAADPVPAYNVFALPETKQPLESPTPARLLAGTAISPSDTTHYPQAGSTQQPALMPRQLITLSALDAAASPNGWINEGVNETLGNNVDAHLFQQTARPHGTANRVFDFPLALPDPAVTDGADAWDGNLYAPSTYADASVVQLFYLCNWMHDKLYALGFTESAGNMQTDNFGKGGTGGDALQAVAQDATTDADPYPGHIPGSTYGAYFDFTREGELLAPRVRMKIFPGGVIGLPWLGPTLHIADRDSSLDAQVVLHEYTHGLSSRLVGGGVGIGSWSLNPQTAGMAEGWSDFYALALLSDPYDYPYGSTFPNAIGTYVCKALPFARQSDPAPPALTYPNYYFGGRRYPYSMVKTVNPLVFTDIDPGQANPHYGVPLNPLFTASNAESDEVHAIGEVWCTMLWQARANIFNGWGSPNYEGANTLMLQIVTEAMKYVPANPNFIEARDNILQADFVNNGGANRLALWSAFVDRGLGKDATAPPSTTTRGVVPSYDNGFGPR